MNHSFVFSHHELPPPIPLHKGTQDAGTPVSTEEFDNLSRTPIQIGYSNNILKLPIADLISDGLRAQVIESEFLVEALNRRGGRAKALHPPEAGLRGNSHFLFSDPNNVQVADQLAEFLEKHHRDMK